MTLDEAREHVGHGVVYRADGDLAEDGVITSVGDALVFVRYAGDQHAKATHPRDLELLAGNAPAGGAARPRGASYANGPGGPKWPESAPRPENHWHYMAVGRLPE